MSERLRTGAWIVLSSVLLAEIALRIWAQFPGDAERFVSDPEVGFRVRPGLENRGTTSNARGFNDVDHPAAAADGVTRVAFVGDSFVFGVVPRRDNLVSVFTAKAARDGRRLEVFNLGIPAAGPESYLGLLRHDAAEARVDVVCVVFFVGNDVSQSDPDFVTRIWLGTPRSVLRSPWLVRPSGDYLYVYKLLRSGSRLVRNRLGRARGEAFSEEVFLEIEGRGLDIFRRRLDPSIEAAYRNAADLLRAMKEESDRHGMQLMVALAPDRLQVEPGLRAKLLSRAGRTAEDYDFAQPQKLLRQALEQLGVPVLDLLPKFRKRAARGLYLPNDTHWNARGNELAGRRIYRFMADRGILGEASGAL